MSVYIESVIRMTHARPCRTKGERMKEIIVHTQAELDAAVKEKDCYIVIRDTKEWVSVYDNATIRSVSGNATIKIFSADVAICSCCMLAVIIMIGCVCKIIKEQKTVTVIKNKIATYTQKDFLDIYPADKKGDVVLYKSVQEDNTDFHTGKIKYEGTVKCPDWDGNKERQCGGGLHLSPLPGLALSYNQGKLLKCKVSKKDFVVYKSDITKVRCKKVTVIGHAEGK